MLIPNIIKKIELGQKINLANGIGIWLSPIFVDDVVTYIIRTLNFSHTKKLRIMNLCGDDYTNLGKIIDILEKITNKKSLRNFTDEEPMSFIGDNTLIKKSLGELEFLSLNNGLKKVTLI